MVSPLHRCISTGSTTNAILPAVTIDILASLSIAGALYAEHHHALRTSAFLGLYLAFGIIIDGTKSRSYFRHEELAFLGYISAFAAFSRLALLLLEEIPRRPLSVDGNLRAPLSREARSGYWSRHLFLWVNSTLLLGFRSVLQVEDLGDLGPEFSGQTLLEPFTEIWDKVERSATYALAITCMQALRVSFVEVALPRLLFSTCSIMQPFLLRELLLAVQAPELSKATEESIILASAMVLFAIGVSRASFKHMNHRLVTRLRGLLVAQVLSKSHKLTQAEAKKSAAVTLISTDIDSIAMGVPQIYEIPFNILDVCLGMGTLSFFVERASLIILVPLVFSIASGYYLGNHTGAAMAAWNAQIMHRVAETSKVLSQLKVIKMIGLGPTISIYLQRLREAEIVYSKKYQAFRAIIYASRMLASTITPVLLVAASLFWTSFARKPTPVEIFPCLAVVPLIQPPLYLLVSAYSHVRAMLACLGRIETYLNLPENIDPRILTNLPDDPGAEKDGGDETCTPEFHGPAIEFLDVSLAAQGSDALILEQVNLALSRGTITAVLGPNGSGKSTLLQSLVGDANVVDGFIYVDDCSIGYADQSPWIRNVSIRENIIGHLSFDVEWYWQILSVCLLVEDLKFLLGGDNYIAGTNGMNLSGGQRHRVSLARALYSRAKMVVLDDIFSALDRRTAVSILYQLCGEDGLLRRLGCTVVISTYLIECLDVVDQLILLDGNGNATIEKNFREDWFRDSMASALSNQATTVPFEKEDTEKASIKRSIEYQKKSDLRLRTIPSASQRTRVHLYSFFLDSNGNCTFYAWVCLVFLVSLFDAMPDVFVRVWMTLAPENMVYLAGYAGVSILGTFFMGASQIVLFFMLASRSSSGLHEKLTRTVMRSTLGFFSVADTGSILNRYSQDMNAIIRDIPIATFTCLYMSFHIILQTGVIFSGTSYMASMVPLMALFISVILYYFVKTSRQVRFLELETKTPLYNHFTETASGLRHIRALRWEMKNFENALGLLDNSQKPFYWACCLQRWLGLALDLLSCCIGASLTRFALRSPAPTSLPAVGLTYLTLIAFGMSLGIFVDSCANLETLVSALSRLQDFVEYTPTEPDQAAVELPSNWPQKGEIELRNVAAKYRNDAPLAIEDISLHIMPGAKVGITGRTGSGKSSLFLSILGFLEYTGHIHIDGVDISTIPRDTLRSRVITISQDYLDLGGTIRNNLLPFNLNDVAAGNVVPDQEINDTLDRVGLLALVNRHGGLSAQLSKVGLSHGQLQLLSIARAIIRGMETRSKLVLIDEATSNVDLTTDAEIQSVLRESFAGCTILMIAHRLETIQDANMFVELIDKTARVVRI